ncbi:sodium:calcium antiporter [Alkalihalobacillus sp. LMS6]|uniref:sodium:calcium antiporter n=1 Tax=Bacillaceae TaxID=186817 RepID=UPI000C073B6B|nr:MULTISPECIES: sodium:calcium antiporter [Bacillaceae]UTR06425.1 sodium:calcium antiporter [Alkalihalobacillus sp. LMS6]
MLYLIFILLAAVTVFAAVKLSTYADTIQLRTGMTGFFTGAVLIAGATSLPEVTTNITAGVIGSPDLAVGNVIGSNLFNLLVLALGDLWFRKKRMYTHVSQKNVMPGTLSLILTLIVAVSLLTQFSVSLFSVGLDLMLVVAVYFGGLYYLNRRNMLPDEPPAAKDVSMSLKGAITRFVIAALIILAAGSYLTIIGDQIAIESGLGQSFVGSLLLAGATSLPEVSVIYLALKRDQFSAAVGVIIGSNMFNLNLLALADVFYRQDALLLSASTSNWITLIGLLLLTTVVLLGIWRNEKLGRLFWLPSIIIVIGYFISMITLYMYS